MNIKFLNSNELQPLFPTIREAWRKDNKNVFVAMLMKEAKRTGMPSEIVIATAGVIVWEWLVEYLREQHQASASFKSCYKMILDLENESATLAGVLP